MNELPEDIRRIITHAASHDGMIQFGDTFSAWEDLNYWQDSPREAALYMIGLKLGIQYDLGVSRIAYIGTTKNLRTRTQSHNACSHNSNLEQLKARYSGGLVIASVLLPGMPLPWLRALEDAALQEASKQLGLYSICNQGRIDSPDASQLAGMIRILPCNGLPFPVTLDILKQQLRDTSLGKLAEPMPAEYWASKSRVTTTAVIRIGTTSEVSDDAPPSHDINPEAGACVWEANVAAWNLKKMQRLVQLCAGLQPLPQYGQSKVRRFAVTNRRVPRPDTWGEVALVQGRIIAGTWLPPEKLWLKILCGKEFLGQATLQSWGYFGDDKSDLPQVRKRKSIWESKTWCKQAHAIKGQLPADFVAKVYEVADLPLVTSDNSIAADHLRLLKASREYDIEEARKNRMYDEQAAIDDDKSRRARDLLRARIEAMFQQAYSPVEQPRVSPYLADRPPVA